MCSQTDIFAPVCDLVPLLAIVWRDSTFCLICFWWNTMQGTILLAFRIVVARSKIRQKKEKQYWIYIVISSSSSPPPPKQDQWYLKPFLTEGNLSFPVVLSTPNRRILVLARVMQHPFCFAKPHSSRTLTFSSLKNGVVSRGWLFMMGVQVVTPDSFQASILLELYEHQ